MRQIATVVLILVILAVGAQLYRLFKQNHVLRDELSELSEELEGIVQENSILQADLEYLADYDNLAKELRSKLNYKSPGEKLIIIVPSKNDTSSEQ